jgi:hypothetical protein
VNPSQEYQDARDLSPGHAGCTLAMHDECECSGRGFILAHPARVEPAPVNEARFVAALELAEARKAGPVPALASFRDRFGPEMANDLWASAVQVQHLGEAANLTAEQENALYHYIENGALAMASAPAPAWKREDDQLMNRDAQCTECGVYGGHAERCWRSPEVQHKEWQKDLAVQKAEERDRRDLDLEERQGRDVDEEWNVEKRPGFAFIGADGQEARADLTIIQRAGTVPVVVATAGSPEQLAAAILTQVFPSRAQEPEPFLLVEHRPDQQRFEHLAFADFRVRDEDHVPRIGDVIARREVVEPGEDLEQEQERSVEPELTQAPRRGLHR